MKQLTRIAIISDIHGNIFGLKAFFEDIKNKKIDEIICLGDVVGYYPYPNEVIELVRDKCTITILGNHDAGVIGVEPEFNFNDYALEALNWTKEYISEENLNWLKTLKKRVQIVRDNKNIYLVHGSPYDVFDYIYVYDERDKEMILETMAFLKTDVLMVGHTHIPVKVEYNNRKIFLNPGSIGQPRNGHKGAYYAILDTETFTSKFYRLLYDFSELQDKVIEEGLPEILAARLDEGR